MGNVLQTLSVVDGLTSEHRRRLLRKWQPREGDFLGPHGSMSSFKNAQGHEIASYFWPAQNPKGVVVIVHGQGAHLVFEYCRNVTIGQPKRYEGSWVNLMNDAGYSVAGIDNQGMGRSGGLFGYVERFDDFVDDVLQLCAIARGPKAPEGFGGGLPLFGMGCSLGGGIALQASMRQPSLFHGLVLLAPMLSLEGVKRAGANRVLVPLAQLLSLLVPTWPIIRTPRNHLFPELQKDWDADPAVYHYPTRVRIGCELMRACDWLAPRMGTVTTPLLIFHSENDTMTDPAGSKALYQRAKVADKTLRLVNSFWHVLTKESGNEALLSEALSWLNDRLLQSTH